jgi:hypothetical protein
MCTHLGYDCTSFRYEFQVQMSSQML